ncbi:hypothetical protein RUM44_011911 [Polyplax serrata]|uniref:Uncharacterized protein n=1 Tax=Polyplax serrata TaxID=468196 RepID=A0ABR1BC01_POLSC
MKLRRSIKSTKEGEYSWAEPSRIKTMAGITSMFRTPITTSKLNKKKCYEDHRSECHNEKEQTRGEKEIEITT